MTVRRWKEGRTGLSSAEAEPKGWAEWWIRRGERTRARRIGVEVTMVETGKGRGPKPEEPVQEGGRMRWVGESFGCLSEGGNGGLERLFRLTELNHLTHPWRSV